MEILLSTWQWPCKLGEWLFKEENPNSPMASAAALYQQEFTACRAQEPHRPPTAQHREKQILAASFKLISKFL